jgi:hypothetical protein
MFTKKQVVEHILIVLNNTRKPDHGGDEAVYEEIATNLLESPCVGGVEFNEEHIDILPLKEMKDENNYKFFSVKKITEIAERLGKNFKQLGDPFAGISIEIVDQGDAQIIRLSGCTQIAKETNKSKKKQIEWKTNNYVILG